MLGLCVSQATSAEEMRSWIDCIEVVIDELKEGK